MSQNIMVPKSGMFYPIDLVNLARASHDRQSTAAMPADKVDMAIKAVRERMAELGVSRWGYRLKVIDPWSTCYALNFDPNHLHLQIHLKLKKRAIRKMDLHAVDALGI